ncbi:Eco57I restriction-modification methylase domain-containing protein [Gracilimonas sediminicola]|uniref:site-specific DNA-methyltransferase (adenine-specific) n=1 Tax=Gracilimonas sediminicola TaxID=2952158 RepID=A0A9X2RBW7_9BACT|nr:N-6 DNA methylase [Gracilimonas sediminicola]MCP9290575.1 Eco57I restriction-modification methylase domain-containing protein [Gracilimonas sediminicola]
MNLSELVEKYDAKRDEYLKSDYNETQVRADFLDPFFELLGWDIKNEKNKPTNEREVLLEEPLKGTASENTKKPDYTFRLFSERKFFVEAKKPNVSVETNPENAKQVRRYGFTAKLKVSVLTNFEYLLIYDCSHKVEKDDSHDKALIKTYHYKEYEDKIDEIRALLGHESVYSGQFDKEWQSIEEKINRYNVDDLFLDQINDWRTKLGKEIFEHEPDIEEERLNDYVQSYINRIIFLRVCEDRNLEEYQTLLGFADKKDFEALIKKFNQADKRYNSGLFDQFLSDKIIGNVSSVFWDIIKQLYYPESPYSFSVFSSDILGSIYEIFLTEKLTLKKEGIELVTKPEKVDRDVVTTPGFIIKSILNQTVVPFCKDKSIDEILSSKMADIACGSGAFLIELYQLLNDQLIDLFLKEDKDKLVQTNINTFKLPFETKQEILLNCIYGIDKDYNAVEASKFGLLLKLLEGEDNKSIAVNEPILPDLSNNIKYGNSLISTDDVDDREDFEEINPFNFEGLNFDVIVGNPPYMKSEDMKEFTPKEYPLYKTKYLSSYKQFDKYFVFVERAIEVLKDGGYLGYIIPSKFLKVGAGKKLREYLQNEGYLDRLLSFGANQVFKETTTYTCILIIEKTSSDSFEYNEIQSLTDWKVSKDEIEYQQINTSDLDEEVWILVPPYLIDVYEQINSQSSSLEQIVGSDGVFNGIQTSANRIYIFQPEREDDNYYYFTKNDREWTIEKELTKPYFKTSRGDDSLHTYRPFKPNARVFYPYRKTDTGVSLVDLDEIEDRFPKAFEYISHYKEDLEDRDIKPEPETDNEWYRYGRHQSLDKCGLPQKIIVGVLSQGDKYAIDYHGTLISSGGTAGYCVVSLPEESNYSIYYIQALLNSKYLEWYSALIGEVFRGGFIARGTKVLNKLPIRNINFDDENEKELHDKIVELQEDLIKIFTKIDENSRNPRQLDQHRRKFAVVKAELDKKLEELYQLGDEDSLIPMIQDIYATD